MVRAGEESVFPLNGDLNLPKDSDSHGLHGGPGSRERPCDLGAYP